MELPNNEKLSPERLAAPVEPLQKVSKNVKRKSKKKFATNFLINIFKMIENESCIKWSDEGDSFFISNPSEFNIALGKYFKTRNISSFIRQLNMYNFSKVRNSKGFYEFRNQNFHKDNIDSLSKIKRKYVHPMKKQHKLQSNYQYLLDEKNNNHENLMSALKLRTQILKETNVQLQSQIENLKREKEDQQRAMTSIFVLLLQGFQNKQIMKQIMKSFSEECGLEFSKMDFNKTNSMQLNFLDVLKNIKKKTETQLQNPESSTIYDDVSQLFEIQCNRQRSPVANRFIPVNKDYYIEEKSRVSCSESMNEPKGVSEIGLFKNPFAPTGPNECEEYSYMDALEMVSMKKDKSKRSIQGGYQDDDGKEALVPFEDVSLNCSVDLFEVQK